MRNHYFKIYADHDKSKLHLRLAALVGRGASQGAEAQQLLSTNLGDGSCWMHAFLADISVGFEAKVTAQTINNQ